MNMKFSTKAKTLIQLRCVLKSAKIAPIYYFSIAEWDKNKKGILEKIEKTLGCCNYIVRSSCKREDGYTNSNAGAYSSILNVNRNNLYDSIIKVINSYEEPEALDEVLIQPMLKNVVRSGVAFSHDPNTCSPYQIVNWTEGSDTSMVTAGKGGQIWQQASKTPIKAAPKINRVIKLLDELILLFDSIPVDCEFAVTVENNTEILWLLQARPLILQNFPETDISQANRLKCIYNKVSEGMNQHPYIMGSSTVYGVMPDWNPAEILGTRPKPLSLSLYRDLITDSIWAYQRHNYGYRNLRSFPLMPNFFGLPYIDVRLSFNSFIPADLNNNLANRLVDYYLDCLKNEPKLHDKIEFEIVFSCYTFDLMERLEHLIAAGFTNSETEIISNSLLKLTNRILNPNNGLWLDDAKKLSILDSRYEKLNKSNINKLERIYWLIEDAKRYGTLPFAGLARAGFIAVQILRSLVAKNIFSETDYNSFMRGLDTVTGQLSKEISILGKSSFLKKYGHLRPGTYDILSPRYDVEPELYFNWQNKKVNLVNEAPFETSSNMRRELTKILKSHDLQVNSENLLNFIKSSIELRELSKFKFTRNLSDVLEIIADFGNELGFIREDLAYCDVSVFKELYVTTTDPKKLIANSIQKGKEMYKETTKLTLPPLISTPNDVWGFKWPESEPNFITQKNVIGRVVTSDLTKKIDGSIVCIPSADPGFDWLFSYPIAGLLTAWGGVNSHMAIRAGELGLPAVIGAGEILYKKWSKAKMLHLDCGGRRVETIA